MLLLFGVGGAAGMVIGGRLGDWKPLVSVVALSLAYAVFYLVLMAVIGSVALMGAAMIFWGFLFLAPCVPLQTRVVRNAIDGPNLASTLKPVRLQRRQRARTNAWRRRPRAWLRLSRVALDRERPRAPLRCGRPFFARSRERRTGSGLRWASQRASLTPNVSTRLDFDRPTRFHFGAPDV
jgi:hypothetical protein